MEYCGNPKCPLTDCEHHSIHAPGGCAYTTWRMDLSIKRLADYQAEEAAKEERIRKMNLGTACVIFQNIDATDISDEETAGKSASA